MAAKKLTLRTTEADILSAVRNWLVWQGYTYWRMPIGGIMQNDGRRNFMMKNPLKGFPDLAGILKTRPGHLWACELKRPKAKPSAEQLEWLARLRHAGANVFVAHSLVEFIARIDAAECENR